MNAWHQLFIYLGTLLTLSLLILIFLVWIIVNIVKKRKRKKQIVLFLTSTALLFIAVLFINSHSTWYSFNDHRILGNHIQEVQKQYGEPDLGTYANGRSGRVGYYIYTDNGPIMPDHLDHYYYIDYDEKGIVTNVFNSCQPGG